MDCIHAYIATCNSCNMHMAMRDLPDMYAGHFVPIVTTPVVLIPQVIVTLVHKVISTNC